MQLNMEDTLTGSTRLVLLSMLVTRQLMVVDPFTVPGSARLVLPLLPAMELHSPKHWSPMASHLDPKSLRVSRTVYVIRVQVHLMMKVSLTSVVTNWTLENYWTSSRTSSSPRSATRSSFFKRNQSLSSLGHWFEEGLVFEKKISVLCVFVLGKRAYVNSFDQCKSGSK